MLSFKKIKGKPNLIRSFTGLPLRDFSDLLPAFDEADKADSSARSRCRQRTIGGGRKAVLSSGPDRLLFILFYFKFYPTQEVLGFFFGLSQGHPSHWIHRLTPILNSALGYQMQLPARKAADVEILLRECPALEFIINGTERPINRPKDAEKQKRYYSGKKRRHTIKNLLISDKKTKRIYALSPTYEGKRHDKSIADAQHYRFPEGATFYKDTGFQGYEPAMITTLQPMKKPKGGQLTESEKARNREISKERVRVEHSIGGVKIYRIVKDIYRKERKPMSIAMTEQQERDFDKKGFIIRDDFLTQDELERLLSAVDEVAAKVRQTTGLGPNDAFAIRNALAHHEAFLDLIDHPRILPLVVDAIGWNIQIRTTHLDYRPPYPRDLHAGEVGTGKGADDQAGYRNVLWHPDLAGDYLFEAPSLDGRLPFMEIKVFYVLSDLSESNSGNLWMVPGSHKRTPQELRNMDRKVDATEAVELKLPPGAAVLWRTATWHCVGPNLSNKTRKIMHVGYHYRWLRPTDYIEQAPDLVAGSSPIRRQLLGALATGSNPLGNDPDFHPGSQYWIAQNWDDVPLKAWVEERTAAKRPAREPL